MKRLRRKRRCAAEHPGEKTPQKNQRKGASMGNIIVSIIVFGIIGAVIFRLAGNARKGKTGCSCGSGCPHCASRRAEE
jgi:hypothetical protein